MPERFAVSHLADPVRAASPWKVDGYREDGRRVRQYFPTKLAAQQAANRLNAEANRTGVIGDLTDAQRIEAEKCFRRCAAAGVSLTEAVEAHLTRLATTEHSATVGEVYDHLLRDRQDKSRLYLSQLKNMLADFVGAFGKRRMDGFTPLELDDFIQSQPWAAKSRNNLRGYLCTLWNHAVKKGLAKENPAKKTTLATLAAHDAEILTPAAMNAVIKAAHDQCAESVTPLVIQAFAGLRSAEVTRLDWKDINLDERRITVSAGKAKTRTRRTVAISDNLFAFLAPLARDEGPVTAACHRVESPIIRAAVMEKGHKWPKNGLRHSFCSYRLTETDNENLTALEAGHSPTMLHRHYKGLASKKAAAVWWRIGLPDVKPAPVES